MEAGGSTDRDRQNNAGRRTDRLAVGQSISKYKLSHFYIDFSVTYI